MAIYQIADMIRMRRKALNWTQEELIQIYNAGDESEDISGNQVRDKKGNQDSDQSNEICSVQVLHRIENGEVQRVKLDVYRDIMKKFGLLPERMYASLMVTDTKALNLKININTYFYTDNYEQAEKELQELETMMISGYARNKQYLMGRRATLAYMQRKISPEEYLKILWDALRLTIPMIDKIDIAEWPFNEEEFNILSGIGNAYSSMDEREKELEFLLKLKKNAEKEYMDTDHYIVWHMRALQGLSQLMCRERQHKKSMEYCETGLRECKDQRILGESYDFLYDIVWNKEQQIREGIFDHVESPEEREALIKEERAFCKKMLVQAYDLSLAQGSVHKSERIKKLYEEFYPEEAKLF